MNSRFLLSATLLLILSACITPAQDTDTTSADIAEMRQALVAMEDNIVLGISEACKANTEDLAKELHQDLRKKIVSAEKSARRARQKAKDLEQQCAKLASEKIVFGEVETVYFEDAELNLDARVDTGAETSSLGIYNLTEFERDGKEWVRFKLKKSKKSPYSEYRIRDDVRIKQRRQDGIEQRFEVRMDIRVGGKRYRRQVFNLADRDHLDYQVLLGRSFLKDIALVDVSLKKQLSKKR